MSEASVNGTRLYYEVLGDGPPLLMMHGGLGLDHTYYRPWFDQLSDVVRLIYYDHRGNGRSERPQSYEGVTHEVLTADADALREYLGHDKLIIFGHSYGGFLAQEYASRYPDRLAGMVLANTIPALDYHPQPPAHASNAQLAAFETAFGRPMEDDADWRRTWTTLWQLYFRKYDAVVGDAIDATTRYAAAAWNSVGPMLESFNMLQVLGNILVPTLVIAGRHDFMTPPAHGGERIHSLLPNSELVVFENSAHYPFIEEEADFFAKLRAWLAGLS